MMEIATMIRRLAKILCLVVIDLCAFYVSLFIAWSLRAGMVPYFISNLPPFNFSYTYFISLWWIPFIYVFFMFYEGLYDSNMPFWDETREMVKSLSLGTLTVMAIVTLGKIGSDNISRLVLLGMWVASLFVFPIFRLLGKRFLYNTGLWRERALILGAGNAGRLAMEGLQREKHMGYDVIGFLDDDESKKGTIIGGKKVFGRVKYFSRYVNELGIKTVIIAIPTLTPQRLTSLTASVQNHAVNTIVIPDLRGIALLNTDLLHLFYEEIFLMNIKNNLKSLTNRAIKRGFDVFFSVLFLPVVLPLIGAFAALIRLETSGPAIYAHERVGKNGKVFRCYKFRTMHKDAEEKLKELLENDEDLRAEWETTWKLKDDPRITRTGRFLRKTSLDELPQLFNVLQGTMSLVGPRPVTHFEVETYYKDTAALCFCVPPGITGLWQVSGRSNTDYDRRVKLDAWYIRNWSLWLDIAILFKTLKVVAKMDGAY
ncbi:MAG TPA: undecaprenyl-phosphate galactose phosphotransferase WbaP [Thermodesulfovibrionales bacterium]|nr:undecaprenyl-phosphate galactose phosphotransferase WbaP [Thermodesulfovibrionales bacterium]